MNRSVIDIIAATLKVSFPDILVYDEQVPQGFKTPSFFICTISNEHEQIIGKRYKRVYKMAVRYFDSSYTVLNSMAEQLFDILEYSIFDGITLHGTKMNYNIDDDVLHFFLDIIIYFDKQSESLSSMGGVKVNQLKKG